MNIEIEEQQIKLAQEQIKKNQAFIDKARQDIANYLCPFEVGSWVVSEDGEKSVIASVSYQSYGLGYSFKVFKLRKDGALSKQVRMVRSHLVAGYRQATCEA